MDALLVFLSGKHLRYCKSWDISVILVLLACFVSFWYVFAASPDDGLERWLVWFSYVVVFVSGLAVAYLLVVCVFFLCLLGLMHAASQPSQNCIACHSIPGLSPPCN